MGGSINGGTPIAGWSRMDNPINMDDFGIPLFQETIKWRLKQQQKGG